MVAIGIWTASSAHSVAAPVTSGGPDPDSAATAASAEHVVIVSIDGLRPDAIERFGATTLLRLMDEGSYSLAASTVLPSRTLPSHTSMLTGQEPAEHGITWNHNAAGEHGHAAVSTIFSLSREAGLQTAGFFSKGKFHHLAHSLDYVRVPTGNRFWRAGRTVGHVERHLAEHRPDLVFVHIGEPDYAGHVFGWMSWIYGRAVRRADRAVADILEAADRAYEPGNYTVIITSDHGGHGRDHGTADPRDVLIPWIAWGRHVHPGTILPDGIRTTDTAATALWILGISASMEGQPVRAAFRLGDEIAAPASRQPPYRIPLLLSESP